MQVRNVNELHPFNKERLRKFSYDSVLIIHPVELKPNDLTIVLTLSANVFEVIFLPGS